MSAFKHIVEITLKEIKRLQKQNKGKTFTDDLEKIEKDLDFYEIYEQKLENLLSQMKKIDHSNQQQVHTYLMQIHIYLRRYDSLIQSFDSMFRNYFRSIARERDRYEKE